MYEPTIFDLIFDAISDFFNPEPVNYAGNRVEWDELNS